MDFAKKYIPKYLLELRLPDSWFMMLLTIILLITTFSIERYVSSINFWKTSTIQKIDLNLHDVNIFEYQNQKLITFIKSTDLIMSSKHDSNTKKNNQLDYENWQITKPIGITYNDFGSQYLFTSGIGYYDRLQNQFSFSDGIEITQEQNPFLLNLNSQNIIKARNFIADKAIYQRNYEMIYLNAASNISADNFFFKSNKISIDVKKDKITLENVDGFIEQ